MKMSTLNKIHEQFRDAAYKSETFEQDKLLIEHEENEEMKFILNHHKFEINHVEQYETELDSPPEETSSNEFSKLVHPASQEGFIE
jgi:hypothetical protein